MENIKRNTIAQLHNISKMKFQNYYYLIKDQSADTYNDKALLDDKDSN